MMSGYTSIREAFPDTALQSGGEARREERRRAKICKGPALAFLKGGGEGNDLQDPDRFQYKKTKVVEKMQNSEGFLAEQEDENIAWIPKTKSLCSQAEEQAIKSLVGQRVDDVIGQKSRNTLPKGLPGNTGLPGSKQTSTGSENPSYFGRSVTDDISSSTIVGKSNEEGFSDFDRSLKDTTGYQLGPGVAQQGADFLASFGAVGLNKSAGQPLLGPPSLNDAWKPLTPTGARSSFFELLPNTDITSVRPDGIFSKEEKEALLKKLDFLFARLEDLESKRNEYAHVEVSLFVLSGLFLIYGLEIVRRI